MAVIMPDKEQKLLNSKNSYVQIYDKQFTAVNIKISDKKIVKTLEIPPSHLIFDLDKDGNIVNIEIIADYDCELKESMRGV